MTYEEFIQQLAQLETNRQYSYVPSATTPTGSYTLLNVTNDEIKVLRDNNEVPVSINHIKRILDALQDIEPLDIESTLGGSGSTRSVIESLLCLTPSIFYTRVRNRKHIVLLSMRNHALGELTPITEEEINEIKRQQREHNRNAVKEDYRTYLTNVARSVRTGARLTTGAIANYLNFIRCDRLFDYAPDRWTHIESIYDITSIEEINNLLTTLLEDQEFLYRNNTDNVGFRSRALKQFRDYLIYKVTHENPITENLPVEIEESEENEDVVGNIMQKIFYGAPGTGKSYKIDDPENGCGLKNVNKEFKFRTTFHPDYDYAQFVGAYKPMPHSNHLNETEHPPVEDENDRIVITYKFAPQFFAKAYVKAWVEYLIATAQDRNAIGEKVYLVIEEINRGNCAQIFGDIFQLLDRECGHSAYPIDVDSDFAKYIENELKNNTDVEDAWNKYKNRIQEWDSSVQGEEHTDDDFCKIALPPNFNILATMNTSDQSLFPMDSAFKRRFDWEYVPIKYERDATCGAEWNADQFDISVGNFRYMWLDFLKAVNANISKVTRSEDKQMGEFFIKHSVDYKEFRSKVLFYLWDSVYKDEEGNKDAEKVFHFKLEGNQDKTLTFQTLFEGSEVDQKDRIAKIMSNLDVVDQNAPPPQQGEQGANAAAAELAPAEEPNPAQ